MFSSLVVIFLMTFSLAQNAKVKNKPNTQDPPTVKNEVANQQASEGEVKKEISQIQSYLAPFYYDRIKFRDPFEVQGASDPLEPGQVYGPFLPLQSKQLSEFNLKGLLWKTQKPVAIFVDKAGVEHRLTIKDYIGENFGYIASIREREVVIIQTIEENGKRYSTAKVVFLQTES